METQVEFLPSFESTSRPPQAVKVLPAPNPLPDRRAVFVSHAHVDRPDNLLLGTLFDTRFRVLRAIPVSIEVEGEHTAAIWSEIDEFGCGATSSAASVDLARSIVDLYTLLDRDKDALGSDLTRVWSVLNQHVQHVERA